MRFEFLAESECARIEGFMEWDQTSGDGAAIAAKIADLQAEELDRFFRERLRTRDLHKVVANLNEMALSKADPKSANARRALTRLGFPD